jgi:hypothetical protein
MVAARSQRDPVPPGQEKVVIARSGNSCAYPACGVHLVANGQHPLDLDKAVGKVAHICAASPGGPRYDAAMSVAERGAAANLMYLCGAHHDAIDSQLNHHSVAFLREAKRVHEAAVARAVRHALGEVTFEDLAVICSVLGAASEWPEAIDLPLEVERKIRLNELGETSAGQIRDGLAQQQRVQAFIEFQSTLNAEFGIRLSARFKAEYYGAVSEGLAGDELFDRLIAKAIEHAGPVDSPKVQAAALAVVSYLFELCEIFEHEVAA